MISKAIRPIQAAVRPIVAKLDGERVCPCRARTSGVGVEGSTEHRDRLVPSEIGNCKAPMPERATAGMDVSYQAPDPTTASGGGRT